MQLFNSQLPARIAHSKRVQVVELPRPGKPAVHGPGPRAACPARPLAPVPLVPHRHAGGERRPRAACERRREAVEREGISYLPAANTQQPASVLPQPTSHPLPAFPQPHGRVAYPSRPKPPRPLPHPISTEYSARLIRYKTKPETNPPARATCLSVSGWTHEIFRWDPDGARDEFLRAVVVVTDTQTPKSKISP
jgi:hypothetical protein